MSLCESLNAAGIDRALLCDVTCAQLSEIEHCRTRIVYGTDFLRCALNSALSPHTRLRCAFESAYLCCCEVAEASGLSFERVEHPSMVIVNAAAMMLDLTGADNVTLRTLIEWASSNSPFLPQLKPEDARVLATDMVVRTIQYFA